MQENAYLLPSEKHRQWTSIMFDANVLPHILPQSQQQFDGPLMISIWTRLFLNDKNKNVCWDFVLLAHLHIFCVKSSQSAARAHCILTTHARALHTQCSFLLYSRRLKTVIYQINKSWKTNFYAAIVCSSYVPCD